MGERKVLNKYYPPDFDPAKMPRGKRNESNEMKVRMMLPMSVRCKTCGTFMYKGTKFNTRKEDVEGEDYLGIRIYRFYWRCKKCAAEFTMKTDPKNADYVLEAGATRNYEPWRDQEAAKVEDAAKREEEERGNAMKALENRTLDSKREMDIMAALDEMVTLNKQHASVTTEQALAALNTVAATQDLDDDDAEDIAEFYQLRQATLLRRLDDDEEDGPGGGRGGGGSAGPGPSSSAAAAGAAAGKGLAAAGPSSAAVSKPPAQAAKPAVKVLVKPKPLAKAPAAAIAAGAKRPAEGEPLGGIAAAAAAKKPKDKGEEESAEGLPGLLGGYGSSSGSE